MPAVAAVILFGYALLTGLSIAFLDYSPVRGISGRPFIGLDNFRTGF
jgi:putative aldouronate transport system permease protein